jgi:hypothetical protein
MYYLIKSLIAEYFSPPLMDNIIFHPFFSGVRAVICFIAFYEMNQCADVDYYAY